MLRSTGYAWDLRKTQPYSGYEDYDFEVQTWDTADAYGRFRIRLDEMAESLRIVEQCADRLAGLVERRPGGVELPLERLEGAPGHPAVRRGFHQRLGELEADVAVRVSEIHSERTDEDHRLAAVR